METKPTIVEGDILDFSSGQPVEVAARHGGAVESTGIARSSDVIYTPIQARVPVSIREATLDDVKFIDSMQKKSTRELGFLPTMAIEGKIKLRQVLIAEVGDQKSEVGVRGSDFGVRGDSNAEIRTPNAESKLTTYNSPLTTPTPIGYLIGADRYFKRDEVGYITQINVLPEYRRTLVAAQLLQAEFDRAAYGCRLYSCWCAQDLKANEFWEAMGFVAIAFRTGSMKKGRDKNGKVQPRVHIFWQKRIRAGDETTPWWYPSTTGGGEMREDRIVFPIMNGVHWREVGPILLGVASDELRVASEDRGGVPTVAPETHSESVLPTHNSQLATPMKRKKSKPIAPSAPLMRGPSVPGGLWFPNEGVPIGESKESKSKGKGTSARSRKTGVTGKTTVETDAAGNSADSRPQTVDKSARPKVVINPQLTAMARELRDQWTEQSEQIVVPAAGKHDVKRIATATNVAEAIGGGLRFEAREAKEAKQIAA